MDSAREAGIQRGGKTKSGAWKRFLLNPFGRVGNTIARLSGKKKKKRVGNTVFRFFLSVRAKHPTRKPRDTNCLLKNHIFNICTEGLLSRCIDMGIFGFN